MVTLRKLLYILFDIGVIAKGKTSKLVLQEKMEEKRLQKEMTKQYKFIVNSSSCNNLDTVHCIGHKHVILTCLR